MSETTTELPTTLTLAELEAQAEVLRQKNKDEGLAEINEILTKRKLSLDVLIKTDVIVKAVLDAPKQIVLK